MPWSGSAGSKTFSRTDGTRTGENTWQDAEGAGVDIVSDDHDTHDQDLATGINTCLTKDGGNTATANIPMGGFTLTNLGAPTVDANPVTRAYAEDELVLITSELTIATGAVTPTKSRHSIDTESDAATDNLDQIVTSNMRTGQILFLYAENASRVVTVRNEQGAAGEVHLKDDQDVDLSTEFPLILQLADGTDWYEVQRLAQAAFTLGTSQSLSGTSVTYTGIPSGVNMLVVTISGASHNSGGNEKMYLRLGDSGGIETTGYTDGAETGTAYANSSGTAFTFTVTVGAASAYSGTLILVRRTGNVWTLVGSVTDGSSQVIESAGSKSLSAELTQCQLTISGGSWDAGDANIAYL